MLLPKLELVSLSSGQMLFQQGVPITHVYLPTSAVMSLLCRMENGWAVEVGTIGFEGFIGVGAFLGDSTTSSEAISQIPGEAYRLGLKDFQTLVAQLPVFHQTIARCVYAFIGQVSQTAACNRVHGIEERCARWLLTTHDRVDGTNTFPLTHQFLSFMLGVRRAGVTEALGELGRSALITSRQGRITILDRRGLEAASCECYGAVRRHSERPFLPLKAN